jgi:putative acetyltransferase
MIALRLEEPEDAAAIRAVHRSAFGGAAEADLVDALRAAGAAVLSLVAVDGEVVGHVLYTWAVVDTEQGEQVPLLGLAPVAVRPDRRGEGIGTRLIEASLEWLREEGYAAVVLVGSPGYYPRFGFLPASRWGLEWERDVPDGVFQAVELSAGGLAGVRGIVRYRPEFVGV